MQQSPIDAGTIYTAANSSATTLVGTITTRAPSLVQTGGEVSSNDPSPGTLTGDGVLLMETTNDQRNYLDGNDLINLDDTIEGVGYVDATLTNTAAGTIDADVAGEPSTWPARSPTPA